MIQDPLSSLKDRILVSFWIFIIVLTAGTIGYWFISNGTAPLIDCLYMTVITVSTVGYGEIISVSPLWYGKLFTIALIFSGMSVILYFISNVTAFFIEGNLKELFWRKKMQKKIAKLHGHYIVVGAGKFGEHVVRELHETKRAYVIIENGHEQVTSITERFPDALITHGDATENEALTEAGIERAEGILVATGNDKDNIVITLTARQMNPGLRIVTRCNDIRHADKLKRAGADSVVSTNLIAGLRMASEMFRPAVVSFLDQMLRDREKSIRIEEIAVPVGSPVRQAGELKCKALVLALKRSDGEYDFNPPESAIVSPGMFVIYMGTPDDRLMLEGLLSR